MKVSEKFIFESETNYEKVGIGVTRQIMGFDDQIMLVKIDFESGSIGSIHSHEHRQCTYVSSGVFEFQIGDEIKIVKAGDGLYMEPNIPHGVKCLEAGRLIDTFSPVRKDFLI